MEKLCFYKRCYLKENCAKYRSDIPKGQFESLDSAQRLCVEDGYAHYQEMPKVNNDFWPTVDDMRDVDNYGHNSYGYNTRGNNGKRREPAYAYSRRNNRRW